MSSMAPLLCFLTLTLVFESIQYLTNKQNPTYNNDKNKSYDCNYAQQLNLLIMEKNTRKVCLIFLGQWQAAGVRTTEMAANNIEDES